jgi:hypothetical protein
MTIQTNISTTTVTAVAVVGVVAAAEAGCAGEDTMPLEVFG